MRCKVCKNNSEGGEINQGHVIKCTNTKCKTYMHIPCAIDKNMIIPLEFMTDYYGFKENEKFNQALPFYCSAHNRPLIKAYQQYVEQLDKLLTDSNKSNKNFIKEIEGQDTKIHAIATNSIKDQKTEEGTKECEMTEINFQFNENNANLNNINNFLQTDFIKFDNQINNLFDNDQIQINSIPCCGENFEKLEFYEDYTIGNNNLNYSINFGKMIPPSQKLKNSPNDDSYCSNFNNLFPTPEFNSINIENNNNFKLNFETNNESMTELINGNSNNKNSFENVSKNFYEFIDKDVNLIKTKEVSNITVSQIKDLKALVGKILSNYKDYDQDIQKMYQTLKDKDLV